nr:hydroxymethylpyrimidine/phosphomethylpyrimidine kinase [uncultured Methanobrevibacter sp.]
MIGLTIAGFDPSGGAGISTDIKTMAAYGVHACAAVTALTAQNPKKVFSVEPVSTSYISQQIDSIFNEYTIKYSKTGLLYSKEIIQLVSKKVDEYDLSIVVDPVMVASAGDALSKMEIADALKKYLLKKTLIVTPNVSDVMITGGHLNGTNIIYNKEKDELSTLHQDLIKSENLHGTGCSLSAAICANLVLLNNNDKNSKDEDNLKIAIKKSTKFIYESVKNGRYGTLNPNFNSKVL